MSVAYGKSFELYGIAPPTLDNILLRRRVGLFAVGTNARVVRVIRRANARVRRLLFRVRPGSFPRRALRGRAFVTVGGRAALLFAVAGECHTKQHCKN